VAERPTPVRKKAFIKTLRIVGIARMLIRNTGIRITGGMQFWETMGALIWRPEEGKEGSEITVFSKLLEKGLRFAPCRSMGL